jgi:hypothetical protein
VDRQAPAGSGTGSRSTGFSSRSGNSLTPVIGAFRVATSRSRRARTSAARSATSPESSAATAPPAPSISWRTAQAARARASVSDSTYQDPPAGSAMRARCASSSRRIWVLRAMRRENAPGAPIASSNGATVTASAPPTPAANPASVPRSRFTYGSRRVSIVGDVTACRLITCAAPEASVTRDHSRRAARSFAMVPNWSAVAAIRNSIVPAAVARSSPAAVSARR